MASDDDVRAEDLLDEIHAQRDLARKDRLEADAARQQSAEAARELEIRLSRIEDERRELLENARMEAERRVAEVEKDLDALRKELQRARQPLDALELTKAKTELIRSQVEKPVERKPEYASNPSGLRLGEKVRVRSIGMEGVVCGIGTDDVEVQVGSMRMRTRLSEIDRRIDLVAAQKEPEVPTRSFTGSGSSLAASPGMEIDLRGQRAEDALQAMERYIESAYLAGMPFVRIIHGKGTGRLRQVLREALRQSPHVERWEDGLRNEGGEGVTVAHLDLD
jgi:DNA mismatch repair protein MutS2